MRAHLRRHSIVRPHDAQIFGGGVVVTPSSLPRGSGRLGSLPSAAVQPPVTTIETWLGAPARSYPDRPATIVDILDAAVDAVPDRVFVVDWSLDDGQRRETTVGEFAAMVSGAVAALDLGPGRRLAIASRNCLDLAVALFACARSGAVMVGLDTRLAPDAWAYQLEHSGATRAVAEPALVERMVEAAGGRLPVDVIGDRLTGRLEPWSYDPATEQPPEAAHFAVVYTSGTTGRPKASRVVHRCSVHSALSYVWAEAPVAPAAGPDTHGVVFSLSYISALHAHVLPALLTGGRVVLVPEPDPVGIARVLHDESVTVLYVVPALWARLLRTRAFADLPALRLGIWGGSPMPAHLVDALCERVPGLRGLEIYGLSETHSPATMLHHHEFDAKSGSVGRPLPCMEARTIGDDGTDVPAGQPGELVVRGSLVTTGYERDDARTAEAIVDGWFHTGDIASIDADGYVTILDRRKDMINRGGTKVFSAEVERILVDHPGVGEAAVVGIPDRAGGEQVAAFITIAAEAERPEASELRRWVRDRLSDLAAPRRVEFVDDLPRTTNGKPDKTALRAALERGG